MAKNNINGSWSKFQPPKNSTIILVKNKTGIKNNGVKPDTASRFGRLGIIRETKGWSFLLELGSINNDLEAVKKEAPEGILGVIRHLFNKHETIIPEYLVWAKKMGLIEHFQGVSEKVTLGNILEILFYLSQK